MRRAYQKIVVTRENSIEIVTLNFPEHRNAIGPTMTNELLWALADAHEADDVRVIVLTGAGKAFCAGGDFAEMTGGSAAERLPHKGDYSDLLLAMVRAEKPIVARVNGLAMGGGLGMVAASHFAVAADDAQLGTPEINVGLFPMMIMAVLGRAAPRKPLLEMMLTGGKIDARTAERCGLVTRVVAPEALDAEVERVVTAIAGKSASSLRLGLEAYYGQMDRPYREALPYLLGMLGKVAATDDAREGITAFLEKRPPAWTGK